MRSQGFGACRVQGRKDGGREGAEVTGKSQKAFTQNLLINITRRTGDGVGTCTDTKRNRTGRTLDLGPLGLLQGLGPRPSPKKHSRFGGTW